MGEKSEIDGHGGAYPEELANLKILLFLPGMSPDPPGVLV